MLTDLLQIHNWVVKFEHLLLQLRKAAINADEINQINIRLTHCTHMINLLKSCTKPLDLTQKILLKCRRKTRLLNGYRFFFYIVRLINPSAQKIDSCVAFFEAMSEYGRSFLEAKGFEKMTYVDAPMSHQLAVIKLSYPAYLDMISHCDLSNVLDVDGTLRMLDESGFITTN